MTTESSINTIATNLQDTKSNRNPNPTIMQHAIQLNIAACPKYPEKFM